MSLKRLKCARSGHRWSALRTGHVRPFDALREESARKVTGFGTMLHMAVARFTPMLPPDNVLDEPKQGSQSPRGHTRHI
jgi:hypothetical protein